MCSDIVLIIYPSGLCPLPGLGGQMQPSPLKRSMSLIPSSPQVCGSDWLSQDDLGGRQAFAPPDHAPLSPQSSVASSGSEQTEDQGSMRNTFQEDGSGMKGQSSSPNKAKGKAKTAMRSTKPRTVNIYGDINLNVIVCFLSPGVLVLQTFPHGWRASVFINTQHFSPRWPTRRWWSLQSITSSHRFESLPIRFLT